MLAGMSCHPGQVCVMHDTCLHSKENAHVNNQDCWSASVEVLAKSVGLHAVTALFVMLCPQVS